MVGITSYGAYVPLFRLGKETAGWGQPIEKPVANFDEDSITMSVAATIDCLNGMDRALVDGLFFASTTSPYTEKQAATTVATAADLRRDVFTADSTNSLRAGTTAMKMAIDAVRAEPGKRVMVAAADCRMGAPRSSIEANSGDGAAALLFGDEDVAVTVEDSYSVSNELLDIWREAGDAFIRSWEDRFVFEEGYLKVLPEAVAGVMKKTGLTPKDFAKAVYCAPDARRHRDMARLLGFAAEAIQDPLFGVMGNTGVAYPLMLLVAALEEAKPGDRILLAGYGDGADAYVLQVTDKIKKIKGRRGIKAHLGAKKILGDYQQYLSWRGLYEPDSGVRRPPIMIPAAPAVLREREDNFRFYGAKCNNCGTVQHPPQRVCTRCHAKDNFTKVRLSDKRAELFTYAMDYISGSKDVPLVISVINFEGGGRILCTMTDRDINEIGVGMPLEMSFRKLFTTEGVHNYFWKSMPVRA